MQTTYFAGGCLRGVQAFAKTLPGVVATKAGRVNEATGSFERPYDGYAECVKTTFDEGRVTVTEPMDPFFEIIDPYSVNRWSNHSHTPGKLTTKDLPKAEWLIPPLPQSAPCRGVGFAPSPS